MDSKQFQKAGNTVVGAIAETLEAFSLSEQQINTVKRIAWSELDDQFGRYADDEA